MLEGAPSPSSTAIAMAVSRTVAAVCVVLPSQAATAPRKEQQSDLKSKHLNFRLKRIIAKFGETSNGIHETDANAVKGGS